MNERTPGLPVHHQLPEFAQTHVHRVSDAIHPSLLLSFSSPPTPIPPNIRVFSNESTLRMRWPKYWSFSFRSVLPINIQDWFPLRLTCLISLQFKGLWVFSNTTVQKHQFFSAELSLWSNSHIHTWHKADFSSLAAQAVKNLPAIQKTWVQSLGQEDPIEEGIETHPSSLAWEIPWTEVPGRLQSMG